MLTPVLVDGGAQHRHARARPVAGRSCSRWPRRSCTRLAMLVTSAVVAVVVYEVVGLRVLRSGWVNLDRVWAGAFLLAGTSVWFA